MIRTLIATLCLFGVVAAQEKTEDKPAPAPADAPPKTTKSGLKYWVVKQGKPGTEPKQGDKVRVHYTGWFTDGRKFDSSLDRNKPFELMVGVGMVIKGWDEGLQLMTEGSRYKFHIPSNIAYGKQGKGSIPPDTDLVFNVEMLKVTKGEPIPQFRGANLEKQKTTDSGLKYEIERAGEGAAPDKTKLVKIKFVLWNAKGDMVLCTQASQMHIGGPCTAPTLPMLPPQFTPKFFPEAAALLPKGSIARFEVPPELCWGEKALGPQLPKNAATVWLMEVVDIIDLPQFVLTPEDKLQKTASGLMYEVLKEGTGPKPIATDSVTVNYAGWTTDGKQFDSSWARGTPLVFPLDRVIAGWTEGLQLMKEGGMYRFRIPGNLAYDVPNARPGTPKGTLIFTVELIKVGK